MKRWQAARLWLQTATRKLWIEQAPRTGSACSTCSAGQACHWRSAPRLLWHQKAQHSCCSSCQCRFQHILAAEHSAAQRSTAQRSAPSVVTASACVSPRVNSTDPCARGSTCGRRAGGSSSTRRPQPGATERPQLQPRQAGCPLPTGRGQGCIQALRRPNMPGPRGPGRSRRQAGGAALRYAVRPGSGSRWGARRLRPAHPRGIPPAAPDPASQPTPPSAAAHGGRKGQAHVRSMQGTGLKRGGRARCQKDATRMRKGCKGQRSASAGLAACAQCKPSLALEVQRPTRGHSCQP